MNLKKIKKNVLESEKAIVDTFLTLFGDNDLTIRDRSTHRKLDQGKASDVIKRQLEKNGKKQLFTTR